MVEDNFWICSTCCRFSEIFQCVINRRICRENPDSKPSYERKIQDKLIKSINCHITKVPEQDF